MRMVMAGMAAALLAGSTQVAAHQWPAPGSLVGVSVEVEGTQTPLYRAVDGSGRYYVEARRGARYAVRLTNRTGERLAVLMTVDGLNVISGERQAVDQRGRMYVLDPYESADIQGWRTSLDDIRRFTFVDEQRSYATRSGKANARMGWIELAVYRERRPYAWRQHPDVTRQGREEGARDRAEAPPATAPPAPSAESDGRLSDESAKRSGEKSVGGVRAYPGTGWGEHAHDPVQVVDFQAQPHAAERITLRYEYASALRALGILPHHAARDRLRERERGDGFAQPPRW
jgi:hypothetical protein